MTDKDKLSAVRAEIERLEKENCRNGGEHFCMRRAQCLGRLHQLIGTLQVEPVSEDLEKVAYTYALKCHPLKTSYGETSPNPEVKDAVIYGAKWQKQQMIKDAIDGEIFDIFYPDGDRLEISAKIPEDKFQDGDKVKIIIIKKE